MSRSAIARIFAGGLAALLVGLLLGEASIALGYAAGVYLDDGAGIVGQRVVPPGVVVPALAGIATMAMAAGVLAVVIAWAAALANALASARRGWFAALLVLGVPTFGIGAVIAYLLGNPRPASAGP